MAYGESIARQVSEEGIVLLTNNSNALPLPENSKISLFSTSSVNPAMWNFTPVAYENAKEIGVPDNGDTYQVY